MERKRFERIGWPTIKAYQQFTAYTPPIWGYIRKLLRIYPSYTQLCLSSNQFDRGRVMCEARGEFSYI